MALLMRANGSVFFHSNNCYPKLIANFAKVKLYKKYSLNLVTLNEHLHNVRFIHTGRFDLYENTNPQKYNYVQYDEVLAQRRSEARRSIIIEVQSEKSCYDVYTYCSQFGKIKEIFHYSNFGTERNFVLIEFEEQENVTATLSSSTHRNYDQIIPTYSTMLWFRNLNSYKTDKKGPKNNDPNKLQIAKHCTKILNSVDIFQTLLAAKSISDQILLLYEATKLNDVGVRLRFYTACQIERSYESLFPNIAVLPFGSSVNGFGKQGCDLDLSIVFEKDQVEKTASRLVYQTKSIMIYEKHQKKRLIEVIADTMNIFLPGISNVRKITEARVPIIKFDQVLTGVECDMAINNMSAYYMSELLYMYGEIDWRVRPLTFTLRKWAYNAKLTTKNIPGPWITNFSISLMVLFFFQQKKILPSLNELKLSATKADHRIADGFVDCSFQRDITKIINSKNRNTESLENLLLDFYTYYGNFDFETKAISIREGKPIPKPTHAALYISNPLEPSLNVSKNVKFQELERIKVAMRNATWQMEVTDEENADTWGLIKLFTDKNKIQLPKVRYPNEKKCINFQELFDKDVNNEDYLIRKEKQKKSVTKSKV